MDVSAIYYTSACEPFVAPLTALLTSLDTPAQWAPAQWRAIASLQESAVSSMVIVHESDITEAEYPLLAGRDALILQKNWCLQDTAKWLAKGASDCLAASDTERVAAWILTQQRRREISRFNHDSTILQCIIDAIPAPIFYKDEQHIYRGCNNAFSRFIGRPAEKIINHSVFDIAPRELAETYYQADCELLKQGGTQRYEAKVKQCDGSLRDIEFHKAVFFKPNGNIGGQVGVMLDVTERNELTKQLKISSLKDPLTGIGNRREFDTVAKREFIQHRQAGKPLSLLALDIDHFKKINDTHGHQVGDEALQFMVNICKKALRDGDSIYRVGGEEFYILLPNTNLSQSRLIAERIRITLRESTLNVTDEPLQITTSIGIAELTHPTSLEIPLRQADEALYRAKREGRDRVCS